MVKEIKEKLHREEIGSKRKIKLLEWVDIITMTLKKSKYISPAYAVENFDYYKIVEEAENKVIVVCWDEGDNLDNVYTYIGEYEK